jgi:GNAT superfamily N-acetyltransferase
MASIREIDIERDTPSQLALAREINPNTVMNEASYVHRMQSVPVRAAARAWVADVDGRAVGRVECLRNFFTEGARNALLNVAVLEQFRGQGFGSELYEVGLRYAGTLGVDGLLSTFHENNAGTAFASHRGFVETRAETEAVLDVSAVTDEPDPGLDLRPVAVVDPRLVHAVDLEATLDMPQTEAVDNIPYDEWEEHVLRHPLFAPEGSFVAMDGGVAAAVSLLIADVPSGKSHTMFTGTLRTHRGRGLARAVKLASIRWARQNGITMMATTNDETNAAMLAVNRRLGFVPAGRRLDYVRTGVRADPTGV